MSKNSQSKPVFSIAATFVRAATALRNYGAVPFFVGILAGLSITVATMVVLGGSLYAISQNPEGESLLNGPAVPIMLVVSWTAFVATAQVSAAHTIRQQVYREKAGWGNSVRALIAHAPLAAVLLLGQWLLISLGLVLLIVPGLIVAVLFSMIVAARVMDGGGPVRAFSQSRAAAKGNGWKLALYLLLGDILGVAVVAGGNLLSEVVSKAYTAFAAANADNAGMIGAAVILMVLFFTLYCVICPFVFGLIPAAAYAELTASRDDRTMASAFD